MTCSVCIATYKRPQLLIKLLNSLYAQELDEDINLEIIVVDNDDRESARCICAGFSNTDKITLYYLTQPEKNISLTRNKAVHKVTGEYILILDDDEVASPGWVNAHLDTFKKFNADIIIGRVVQNFETEVPDWIRNHLIFKIPAPPTGTEAKKTYTGNSAIRASIIKDIEGPFDPALGLTGGEDTILFEMIRNKGAKIVCCYEALATEFIPSESANLKWMIDRTFRQGYFTTHNSLKCKIRITDNIFSRIFLGIKALVYLFISILLLLITFFNKTFMVHWLIKIVSNWGHFLATIEYQPKVFQ